LADPVVVSPDVGGIKMARAYSKRLRASLAMVDKRRINHMEAEVMDIMGEVKGKSALIVDDLVSTAGSLVEAVRVLKEAGAREVMAAITHAVLSGPARERLSASVLRELAVTDTIPIPPDRKLPKIKVLSVTPLFAEAIRCIHEETSISVLFHQQWEEETRKESAEKRRLTRVVETPVAEKKKLYLTVEEVARRWRISKATLYRWIHFAGNPKLNRENYPQPAKFGRRYLWLESDLLAFEGKNPDGIRTQS